MVTLFCAIVGAKGNAFSIDIDASRSVDHLKKAIKSEKPNKITCDADELQLFLSKKGDVWLTENEVKYVTDTNGLKHLSAARAELDVVGLSEEGVRDEVDRHEVAAGNGPVNVLVQVPTPSIMILTRPLLHRTRCLHWPQQTHQ